MHENVKWVGKCGGLMKLLYLMICCAAVVWSNPTHQFCPLSSHYDTTTDHRYHYPASMLTEVALWEANRREPFNCSSNNFATTDKLMICPNSRELCPVIKQNVLTAMHVADWPQHAEAIYRIERSTAADKVPHSLNIFYLGGSMTHGSQTYGACVCNNKIDSRCPPEELPYTEGQCSWPTMFTSWITRQFPWVQFKFFDFSSSGLNSKLMSEQIGDLLRQHVPGAKFTANDIVLADHSANDRPLHPLDIQQGFELLIRRLLHASGTNSSAHSDRPTIIVMEQIPKAEGYKGPPDVVHKITDYAYTYRKVSRHYGVILWSLREVYWTYETYSTVVAPPSMNITGMVNANETTHEVRVRDYPNDPNEYEIHGVTHPPWYIHLFIADVLAGCVLHTMSLLSQARNELTPAAAKLKKLYMTSGTASNASQATSNELPPPLLDITAIGDAVCDMTQPFLLDAHPNTTFQPEDVHSYETDKEMWSHSGWRPYIDHHEVPGWMINDLSDPAQKMLTFTIADVPRYVDKRVKVVYLKSYVGMGKASVWICGDRAYEFDKLDGLYHDYETYHFSGPEIYIHTIGGGEGDRCSALAPAQRTIQIEYDAGHDHLYSVRSQHNQKFKVMSVEMCTDA